MNDIDIEQRFEDNRGFNYFIQHFFPAKIIYFLLIFGIIIGLATVLGEIAGHKGALLGNCDTFYSNSCGNSGSFLRTLASWTVGSKIFTFIFWPAGFLFNIVAFVLLYPNIAARRGSPYWTEAKGTAKLSFAICLLVVSFIVCYWSFTVIQYTDLFKMSWLS